MNINDRFTERAKTAIERAQEAAETLGHSYVGSEHLLLGIAREGIGQGARALRTHGLTDAKLTGLVEQRVGKGAHVRNSILMQGDVIEAGVEIEHVILDKHVTVQSGSRLIAPRLYPIVVGKNKTV